MTYRRWAASAALVVVLAAMALAAPSSASAAAACPAGGFTSELSDGRVKIGNLDPATGASGSVCGLVQFTPAGTFEATIAKDNISFDPLSVPVGLLSIGVQIVAASDFTGPVTFAADGIHLTLSGQVTANAKILLGTCVIGPFSSTLTTDVSGSLVGAPFNGPSPAELSGSLVGNQDPVPAVKSTLQCPFLVSGLLNAIVGLPAAAGESSLSFHSTLDLAPAAASALLAN